MNINHIELKPLLYLLPTKSLELYEIAKENMICIKLDRVI